MAHNLGVSAERMWEHLSLTGFDLPPCWQWEASPPLSLLPVHRTVDLGLHSRDNGPTPAA